MTSPRAAAAAFAACALICFPAFAPSDVVSTAAVAQTRAVVAQARPAASPGETRPAASPGEMRPASSPGQTVSAGVAAENGKLVLSVFSAGEPYTIDVRALRFTVESYDGAVAGARANATALDVDAGAPVADADASRSAPGSRARRYTVPLRLRSRPVRPGMFLLRTFAGDGFARAGGTVLAASGGATPVYFPDERDGDRALQAVRKRFAGGVLYGYGGIEVGCPPAWRNGFSAAVPIRVRSVERERDRAVYLGTGVVRAWYNAGFSFIAMDPLAILVDMPPRDRSVSSGGSTSPALQPCPALRLADPWQVDVTVSPVPPPAYAGLEARKIRIGVTRDEVRWYHGYPPAYGDAPSFDRAAVWSYPLPAPFAWSVTFANDRVVRFDGPADMR